MQATNPETSDAVEHLAQLPLPYSIVHACGAKAMAMAAELHMVGYDLGRLGTARSYIPDLSAIGIYDAYATNQTMHTEPWESGSFSERLKAGIGNIQSCGDCVKFGSALIRQDDATGDILVSGEAPGQQWRFPAPGKGVWFCNHTALLLDDEIVDPSYERSRALTLAEWKERQNFPEAIITTGSIIPNLTPLRIRTELLSKDARTIFGAILLECGVALARGIESASWELGTDPKKYSHAMGIFFHLQSDLSPRAYSDTPALSNYYNYARNLSRAVLKGNDYHLVDDRTRSGELVTQNIVQLAPVYAYQRWLKVTQAALIGTTKLSIQSSPKRT